MADRLIATGINDSTFTCTRIIKRLELYSWAQTVDELFVHFLIRPSAYLDDKSSPLNPLSGRLSIKTLHAIHFQITVHEFAYIVNSQNQLSTPIASFIDKLRTVIIFDCGRSIFINERPKATIKSRS